LHDSGEKFPLTIIPYRLTICPSLFFIILEDAMKKRLNGLVLLTLITSLVLMTGCSGQAAQTPTVDPKMVYTEVAQTVQAQITSNAKLTPKPTNTPQPTETLGAEPTLRPSSTPLGEGTSIPSLTPGNGTGLPVPTQAGGATQPPAVSPDKMLYISQKVADNSTFSPNQGFTQTWVIQNIGTTTWDNTYLVRLYAGERFNGQDGSINQTVKPNQQAKITMDMRAPGKQGEYTSVWVITNPDGRNFGSFTLTIKVK
jgi:hypothetical protein